MISSQTLNSFFASAANVAPAEAPTAPVDSSRLITLAQQGDRTAVTRLYREYVQRIYRYIVYRVPSRMDAENLTAEVFFHMVKGLPAYRMTNVPFEAWLYQIAAAQVSGYYRHTNRKQGAEVSKIASNAVHPPEEILKMQMFRRLGNALRTLPEEYQTILILRFAERKSLEEVAVLLDKTVSTVRNAQYHALTRLTQLLEADRQAHHSLRESRV